MATAQFGFSQNNSGCKLVVMNELAAEAWIGDAVLTLYARLKIVQEDGRIDGEKSKRLTSNQFLASFGEPTKVEAEVGRVYARDGLTGAFQWIETTLLPLFEKQEGNRNRKGPRK
jgi:hypothetical protein